VIRLLRITGVLFIAAGVVVILTWLIEPLRDLWPLFYELPLPIRVGLCLAGLGLLVLLGTLLWERFEEREQDHALRDDP
jgi:pilus assembly protein TadC